MLTITPSIRFVYENPHFAGIFFFVIEAEVSKSLLFVRIQIKNKMFYLFSFNLVLCFYRFHFFIFDQVLEIAKKFLVFDGEENNMFVVPVLDDNGFDIDWKTMQMYKQVPPVEVPSYEVKKLKNICLFSLIDNSSLL